MLEIGLWRPIEDLYEENGEVKDPFKTRRGLISIAQNLKNSCGEIHTKVTVSNLRVDPEDSEKSLIEQRELCARIAADLAQCHV